MRVVVLAAMACGRPTVPAPVAPADTAPPPTETGDTGVPPASCEWTAAHTPACDVWTVSRDLRVDRAEVPAGVTVAAGPGVVIVVQEAIVAEGRQDAPIVFTSQGTGPWGGLVLDATPSEAPGTSGYYPDAGYTGGDSNLVEVEIRDAGAGQSAAIVLRGGYRAEAPLWAAPTLRVRDLTLRGSVSGGIDGGRIDARSPIGFADVAGVLIASDARFLGVPLVADLGGNATPVITVEGTELLYGPRWVAQSVPIHVLGTIRTTWCWFDTTPSLEIDPNTVLFAPGAGFVLTGGGIDAEGVTFDRLDPAQPWDGIAVERSRQAEGYAVPTALTGVTIGGASPAITWRADAAQALVLTDTVIHSDGVCIEGCVAVDPSNTLDCPTAIDCPEARSGR